MTFTSVRSEADPPHASDALCSVLVIDAPAPREYTRAHSPEYCREATIPPCARELGVEEPIMMRLNPLVNAMFISVGCLPASAS